MQSRQSLYLLLAVVALGAVGYFAMYRNGMPTFQNPNKTTKIQNTQGVASIRSNFGSVAGVDLNGLADEANQSAALSAQDSMADVKTMSTNSSTISNSTDAVSNPLQ